MSEQARQARRVLGLPTGEIGGVVDRILSYVPAPLRVSKERRAALVPWVMGLLLLAIVVIVAVTEVVR